MSAIFKNTPQLDHIAIGVNSLRDAEVIYEALGFTLMPRGRHEQYGTENSGVWFKDNSYLELLTYFDKVKASWLVDFLNRQVGAPFFVLRAASLNDIATTLRQRGFDAEDPRLGSISYNENGNKALTDWKTLFLPQNFACRQTMFLIEYGQSSGDAHPMKPYSTHTNCAESLLSVWIAVSDREPFAKEYELLGLKIGREWKDRDRKAYVTEIWLNNETKIELLQSICVEKLDGVFSQFPQKEGIVGCTIQISNFEKCRTFLLKNLSKHVVEKRLEQHHSLWVLPTATNGILIELRPKKTS